MMFVFLLSFLAFSWNSADDNVLTFLSVKHKLTSWARPITKFAPLSGVGPQNQVSPR